MSVACTMLQWEHPRTSSALRGRAHSPPPLPPPDQLSTLDAPVLSQVTRPDAAWRVELQKVGVPLGLVVVPFVGAGLSGEHVVDLS